MSASGIVFTVASPWESGADTDRSRCEHYGPPNAALPGSRYCGLPAHQALAETDTDYVVPPEEDGGGPAPEDEPAEEPVEEPTGAEPAIEDEPAEEAAPAEAAPEQAPAAQTAEPPVAEAGDGAEPEPELEPERGGQGA